MGRQHKGPLLVRGRYYARFSWRDEQGKQHELRESLKTTNRTTALHRWPAAMDRLKRKASGNTEIAALPIRPDDVGWTLNENDQPVQVTAAEVLEPEAFSIDWQQAWDIHCKRKEARTGRALAASTQRSALNAWKGLGIDQPAAVQVTDVRDYVTRLQADSYAATSINQRIGLLGAIYKSLQSMGWIDEGLRNPFYIIDTSAAKTNHHRAASKNELKLILDGTDGDIHLALKLQLYLGLRIGEVTSRSTEHLKHGWLTINATDDWRPKSKHSERVLPVPDWCKELPQRFPQRTALNNWIKRTTDSRDLSSHGLRGAWRTASREAEISTELAEHLIGHSQSTQLINTYGEFSAQAKLRAMQKVWEVIDQWLT
jgi:site-specific recombinase XerD